MIPEDLSAARNWLGFWGSRAVLRSPRWNSCAQAAEGASFQGLVDDEVARIDWSRPAVEIDRLIRGLSPFPGAWCEMDGVRVKLLGSRLVAGSGAPGAVIGPLTVACGQGAVEITRAQKPGGRAMDAGEFLRGFQMPERVD